MTRVTKGANARPLAVWAALLACAACALAPWAPSAAAAKGSEHAPTESEQAFKAQLAAGEIKSATFRVKDHALHLVLKDGRHELVHLSGPPSAKLRAELTKHGAAVSKKSPPHKLRYIVGGVVVAAIVIGVGVFIWRRRRSAALDEY